MNSKSKVKVLLSSDISLMTAPPNENGEVRTAPSTFKMGRAYSTQAPTTERNLFDILEEQPEEERSITIAGLPKTINETDLSHYMFAIRKILYNQSYTNRNEDVNSGLRKEECDPSKVKPMEIIKGSGKRERRELQPFYKAQILTSLNALCAEAYGTDQPSTEQRKRMATMIHLVHSNPIKITLPNGDTLEAPLVINMGKYTRAEDGAIFYELVPNPIFTGREAMTNFAQLPQRANHLLTAAIKKNGQRRGEAHLRFMERLAMQDTSKPYKVSLDNLLQYLNLADYFRKNPKNIWGRTEADQKRGKLWQLFQVAIDTGQLLRFEVSQREYDGATMFIFHLNPDYCK